MSEEKVVGLIEGLERRFGAMLFLALCFTPQRLVIARTGHHNTLVWAFTLELGNALMMARAIGKARTRAQELAKLPIDEILRADPYNHQVLYADIEKNVHSFDFRCWSIRRRRAGSYLGMFAAGCLGLR